MTVGRTCVVCYNLFCLRIPAHIWKNPQGNNFLCKSSTFTCIFYTGKQRHKQLPTSADCYTPLPFEPAHSQGLTWQTVTPSGHCLWKCFEMGSKLIAKTKVKRGACSGLRAMKHYQVGISENIKENGEGRRQERWKRGQGGLMKT